MEKRRRLSAYWLNGQNLNKYWIFVLGICLVPVCSASFNLFIGVDEVKTLLGLSKELYYVREGVLNSYALQFTVPVPAHVNALHFTWQTLGQKPLAYTSSIEISDSLAMEKPIMNISSRGVIPTEPQTFQVSFPCTGALSDEAYFELTLNVTFMTGLRTMNTTSIVLKRKRICLLDPNLKTRHRGSSSSASAAHPPPQLQASNSHLPKKPSRAKSSGGRNSGGGTGTSKGPEDVLMISTPEEAAVDNSNMIYIVMGSTMGLVVILITLASGALAFVRRRKVANTAESSGFLHVDTSGHGSSGSGSGTGSASGGSLFIRSESPHHYSSVSPCHDSDVYSYSSFHPHNPNAFYAEISNCNKGGGSTMDSSNSCKLADMMTIARCKVRLQSVILEGTFAKIYNGTVLERDGSEKKVIVKTVNDHSSPVQMALLLHEGLSLVGMAQPHVYSVMGVAAEERVPPFLIYADDGFRNLKRFLQRCRSGPGRPITAQEVVHMAIQIASGLAFLHRQNVTHRDVAARNCVVDDKLTVKVSDCALSRDLFPDDYHWMGEAESRPVKWMSPEVILQYRASAPADMWSFGVLLWELATLAQQPYAEIEFEQLVSFLKMGYRLAQPVNCPDELYSSMTRCWTWEGDDRPKWTHVLPELQALHAQLAQYV